jgi:hypothetical protein
LQTALENVKHTVRGAPLDNIKVSLYREELHVHIGGGFILDINAKIPMIPNQSIVA